MKIHVLFYLHVHTAYFRLTEDSLNDRTSLGYALPPTAPQYDARGAACNGRDRSQQPALTRTALTCNT